MCSTILNTLYVTADERDDLSRAYFCSFDNHLSEDGVLYNKVARRLMNFKGIDGHHPFFLVI